MDKLTEIAMIDTIHIRLNLNDFTKRDYYFETLKVRAGLIKTSINLITHENSYRGNFKNFQVFVKGYYVTIAGSLAKYHLNNNVDILTKEGISQALKQITKDLGIPLQRGTLSRIDIAVCLQVLSAPEDYMKLLTGIKNGYAKNDRGSLYFHRKFHTAIWYDKLNELEEKDHLSYLTYKEKGNLLRYELRFEKKLKQILNRKDVKVYMLHSTSFLSKLAKEWIKNYDMTSKRTFEITSIISSFKVMREFVLYKGVMAMLDGGSVYDLSRLIGTFKKNGWSAADVSRCKRRFEELYNNDDFSEKSTLIKELDELIYGSEIVQQFVQQESLLNQAS